MVQKKPAALCPYPGAEMGCEALFFDSKQSVGEYGHGIEKRTKNMDWIDRKHADLQKKEIPKGKSLTNVQEHK